MPSAYQSSLLEKSIQRLAQADIELHISKKRVKNINFRLKPHKLMVSVPLFISSAQAAQAVAKRVPWAIAMLKKDVISDKNVKSIQFAKPYFQFSAACAGCGETCAMGNR